MTEHENVKYLSELNSALKQLKKLVGEWEMQFTVDGEVIGRGRTRFAWMENRSFVIQHADADPDHPDAPPERTANSPMPLTNVIGLDDSTERFSMLYADARGVFRIYQMSLRGGVWKLWRDAPGFFQRFTGIFSDHGKTITGRWETSGDGSTWEHDFDVTYTKVKKR